MRVSKLLRSLAGLCRATVITGWFLDESEDRSELVIQVRARAGAVGLCGRCGQWAGGYDAGGGVRRWRESSDANSGWAASKPSSSLTRAS